jgi:hypothetical protein
MQLDVESFEGFQAAYNRLGDGGNGRIAYSITGGLVRRLWAPVSFGVQLTAVLTGGAGVDLSVLTDWHGSNVMDLSPGFTVTV